MLAEVRRQVQVHIHEMMSLGEENEYLRAVVDRKKGVFVRPPTILLFIRGCHPIGTPGEGDPREGGGRGDDHIGFLRS